MSRVSPMQIHTFSDGPAYLLFRPPLASNSSQHPLSLSFFSPLLIHTISSRLFFPD